MTLLRSLGRWFMTDRKEDKPYNANSKQSRREPQKPDERRVEPWPILLPLPNPTQHLHARAARRREGYFLLYRGRTQRLRYPRNNEPIRRRQAARKVKWWNQRAWKELWYTVMSINGLSLSCIYAKLCTTPPAQHNLCQHTEATNAGSREGIKKKKSHTRSIIPKNISSPLSSTFPQKHLQTTEKKLGFGFLPCLKPYHKSGFLQFLAFSSCHRLPQDTSYHSTKHLIIWTFPKAQMTFIDVAPKAQHVIAPCSFGSVS